jgi:hypothetical protein
VKQVVPKMIRAEARNVPRVLEETMIVTTLGGLIAFIATLGLSPVGDASIPWSGVLRSLSQRVR